MCRPDGETCVDDLDCCDGSACNVGVCQSTAACTEAQETCSGAAECCTGLQCREIFDHSDGEENRCCASAETGCTDDWDCCGALLCENDECVCAGSGGDCIEDDECCEGDICVLRTCTEDTGCQREGTTCNPADPQCCGPSACQQQMSATGPYRCCARLGAYCEGNAECCGMMECGEDNTCQARGSGETCLLPSECVDSAPVCVRADMMTVGRCGTGL